MNKVFFISALVFILSSQNVLAVAVPEPAPVTTESKVEVTTPATGLDKAETKLREIFVPIYLSLEIFRNKEAEHFAFVRDKTKVKLGISLAEDALEKIKPFLAPPPAPTPIPGSDPSEGLNVKKLDNPKDYATLIGSTGLASLFASIWMFYTALILLTFFLIRLVFKMIL